MNKQIRKLLIMLLLVMGAMLICDNEVQAASKAKYSYQKVDKSRTYDNGRIKAKLYYKKAVLKGNSKVIKKINSAINKDCTKFLKSETAKMLFEYAQAAEDNDYYADDNNVEFFYYANSKVTYNGKGVISVKITTKWFAGGVGNIDVYGLTYSLKTGKRLRLTDVCNGSASQIKDRVVDKIWEDSDASYAYWDTIYNYKVKKMDFYLKPNNKAMVCFGPYEINSGGSYRQYKIKSKYK